MPQRKLKVKAKLPASVKSKKKSVKGSAVTKRKGRPASPKKAKNEEAQKLKKAITKTVNQAAEEDIRARALDGKKSVSKRGGAAGASKKAKKK